MATTTNYSWSTPDDTALVKDGAAAIRSLGTAIDATVFTNAGAAIAKATVDAKGDLIAGTADNTVARLAVGANDTVLTADSATATGLKWAALSGGKLKQLVRATDATSRSTTSATFTDANISVTITPTSATSTVLLIWSFRVYIGASSTDGAFQITDSSDVAISGAEDAAFGNQALADQFTLFGYASPATTSATTYKGRFMRAGGAGTVFTQNQLVTGQLYALEIGA
jgi:carbon monoxide dehydrogenase subunit G